MFKKIQAFYPVGTRAGWTHYVHYFKEQQPQADVSRLVSRLNVKIRDRAQKLSQPDGPEGRLMRLRLQVTGLLKYERIELPYYPALECQGYAERLISDAIRYGDCHVHTMRMADIWILEKNVIHKLFKVLVPRFENFTTSYTKLYGSPRPYYADGFYRPPKDTHIDHVFGHKTRRPMGVIELKGHPYPPIVLPQMPNPRLLSNVLLRAASEESRKSQVEESLKAQGLLSDSGRVHNIIAKSAARLKSDVYLGYDQERTGENAVKKDRGESEGENVKQGRAESDVENVTGEEVKVRGETVDSNSPTEFQLSEERNRISADDDTGVKNVEKSENVTETTKPN